MGALSKALLLFAMNWLDAQLTILWLRLNVATEGNGIMAALLNHGESSFLSVKLLIGALAAYVLYRFAEIPNGPARHESGARRISRADGRSCGHRVFSAGLARSSHCAWLFRRPARNLSSTSSLVMPSSGSMNTEPGAVGPVRRRHRFFTYEFRVMYRPGRYSSRFVFVVSLKSPLRRLLDFSFSTSKKETLLRPQRLEKREPESSYRPTISSLHVSFPRNRFVERNGPQPAHATRPR